MLSLKHARQFSCIYLNSFFFFHSLSLYTFAIYFLFIGFLFILFFQLSFTDAICLHTIVAKIKHTHADKFRQWTECIHTHKEDFKCGSIHSTTQSQLTMQESGPGQYKPFHFREVTGTHTHIHTGTHSHKHILVYSLIFPFSVTVI